MNLPKIDLLEVVAALLARGEPLTAAQLAAATGKSQPSISLAVKALGERVHRIGAARSTRYALKKDILGLPAEHELSWNGADASGSTPWRWGRITYLHGDYLHVRSGRREWLTRGKLPWFLSPMVPEGFLGRALAKTHSRFPSNPETWALAQILHANISSVDEYIGAFSFTNLTSGYFSPTNDLVNLGEFYDNRSAMSNNGSTNGAFAAGEQPKLMVAGDAFAHFIVKFTPPHSTPFGQRWRSLLLLEELASKKLQSKNISCASTRIIQTEHHTYLQSQRFDRNSNQQASHIVAIKIAHDEFVGSSWSNWLTTSEALANLGMITAQELSQIASIFAFGHYIGNTDMNMGNLSFFVDDVIKPTIRLAPVYDMLPMMWKPDPHQGLSDSPVRKQIMQEGFDVEKTRARGWAIEFWERAAQLDIGADLQAASLESARRLETNFTDV